jgi:hypothetical protein
MDYVVESFVWAFAVGIVIWVLWTIVAAIGRLQLPTLAVAALAMVSGLVCSQIALIQLSEGLASPATPAVDYARGVFGRSSGTAEDEAPGYTAIIEEVHPIQGIWKTTLIHPDRWGVPFETEADCRQALDDIVSRPTIVPVHQGSRLSCEQEIPTAINYDAESDRSSSPMLTTVSTRAILGGGDIYYVYCNAAGQHEGTTCVLPN